MGMGMTYRVDVVNRRLIATLLSYHAGPVQLVWVQHQLLPVVLVDDEVPDLIFLAATAGRPLRKSGAAVQSSRGCTVNAPASRSSLVALPGRLLAPAERLEARSEVVHAPFDRRIEAVALRRRVPAHHCDVRMSFLRVALLENSREQANYDSAG